MPTTPPIPRRTRPRATGARGHGPIVRAAILLWIAAMVAACADGGQRDAALPADFAATVRAAASEGGASASPAAVAPVRKDTQAAPVYPLAAVQAYIAGNALYDPWQVHQAALVAGLSAAQLDALYGLPAGTAVDHLTRQGWAPLPGGAVIEGLSLAAPVYRLADVQQLIQETALQQPRRVYDYALSAQLDGLQIDALYGLPPGSAAAYIDSQGWPPLAGGATVDGLSLPLANITAGTLAYGRLATFTITGDDLSATPIAISVERCAGAAVVPGGSNTVRQVSCTVAGTGPMTIRARNPAGTLLMARTFVVPEPQVTLQTTLGEVVLELNPTQAPVTVGNFLRYVNDGYYPGTIFHRVIAGFVVQGGGFTSGLVPKPAYAPIPLESNNGLSNLRGTVAMARTTVANSATTQFYVNLVDNRGLDYASPASPGYAVFGRVVQGMAVIDAIAALPTTTVGGFQNVPLDEVVIGAARQTR